MTTTTRDETAADALSPDQTRGPGLRQQTATLREGDEKSFAPSIDALVCPRPQLLVNCLSLSPLLSGLPLMMPCVCGCSASLDERPDASSRARQQLLLPFPDDFLLRENCFSDSD